MGNSKMVAKFLASLAFTSAVFILLYQDGILQPQAPALGAFMDPFSGFWQQAEPVDQADDLTLTFAGLKKPVRVVFDERRVPHIFADDPIDAAFAQGYLMARDRLWQMDMVIRAISGRLSEVLGESTLEYDRQMRRYGMARSAAEDYESMRHFPFDHGLAMAYADGVNAWLAKLRPRDYPIEFKLLGYAPQNWEASHLNLVQKYMAMDLCFRSDDLAASNALKLLGEDRFNFLFPEWNPRQSPVIPEDVAWTFEPIHLDSLAETSRISQFLPYLGIPGSDDRIGSNNWAVSGKRTERGFPILANDPHLSLNLPSIWYELQVHTPEFNAYGVTLPCLPGIIIGFNQDMAWGLTNVGHDVLDFYRIDWQDSSKTHYLLDGEARPVEAVSERIFVKGRAEPVTEVVLYTHWGPVVEAYSGEEHPDMAMRWLGHMSQEGQTKSTLGVFYDLMRGKGYDDYDRALKDYPYPAQNFALASRAGDVALKVAGIFPLRKPGQGRFIQDGSRSDGAWQGYIPYDQIPQVRNPERGWVSSANQHSTGPSYPYYYTASFDDYRGRYINRVLGRDSSLSVEDMMALQNDTYSIQAEEALPVLLSLLERGELGPAQADIIGKLSDWDLRFEAGRRAPTLFQAWLNETRRLTYDEWAAWGDSIPVLYPQDWRWLELLASQPDDALFDIRSTPETEDAADLVSQAFTRVCPGQWEELDLWEDAKPTLVQHMGRIGAFSVPVKTGGYRQAPNAMSEGHGPSWRMIVELGPEPVAYGVYPGGASGNPGSPYYDKMIDKWARGEYYPLFFMRDAEDDRQGRLHEVEMKPRY